MMVKDAVELARGFMFVAIGMAALIAAWSTTTKNLGQTVTRNVITGEVCVMYQCSRSVREDG